MSVKEYGKEKLQGLKGKIAAAVKIFAMKAGIIIGGIFLIIIILVSVISSLVTSALGGDDEEGAENWESSSEESWEQFERYMITKEGGTKEGGYYIVEDDSAGNPTVGYGLCLYNKKSGEYLNVEAFKRFKIDSKELADNWLKGDRTGKVKVEICDTIWRESIETRYETIEEKYGTLGLTNYQYYALVDVQYRRGNTDGFESQYKAKWKKEYTKLYYGQDTSKETYDLTTLYSFFWNGGHSKEGVRKRKKEQWLLFKYGYYQALNETAIVSTGGTGSGNYDTSCASGYILGKFTSTKGRTYTVINQNKISGWGSNCNRAAAIIIASGYSKKSATQMVNIVMNREIWPEEQGGSGVAKYKDLGASLTVKDEIWSVKADNGKKVAQYVREATKVGGCVTLRFSSRTGPTENSKSSWAYSGHWITILDYRKKNGKEEMFVAESGHGNTEWYPINEFAGSTNIHYLSKIIPK